MRTKSELKLEIHGKKRIVEAAKVAIEKANTMNERYENLIAQTQAEQFTLEDELEDLHDELEEEE